MKIRVELLSKFLRSCSDDGVLLKIIEELKNVFGNKVVCEQKSFALVDISFTDEHLSPEEVITFIKKFVKENYRVRNVDHALTCTCLSKSGEEFSGSLLKKGEEEDKGLLFKREAEDKPIQNLNGEDKPHFDGGEDRGLLKKNDFAFDDIPEEAFQIKEDDGEESATIDSLTKDMDDFIGCEQFKELMREISQVAPFIKNSNTYDCFYSQNYLFSINDGYGLTTALNYFAKVLKGTGLRKLGESEVLECKVPYPKNDNGQNPVDALTESLKKVYKEAGEVILCVDISEWLNSLNNPSLRNFISETVKMSDKFTFVFRIPFVNEDVFNRVKDALGDTSFIRGVVFPTLSSEELRFCATKELKKFGFEMSADAWELFDQRVVEEKRDGRFYGYNTVRKIIYELIYKKQIICAKNNSVNNVIAREEASTICTFVENKDLSLEMLDGMVGGKLIKARVEEILAQIEIAKKTGLSAPCLHMRFVGNPGTGKTTVARIIGKVLKERGVLRIGNFFEYAGRDFCGRYVGETAPKTSGICRDAYGSVLFIDEAYSLYREGLSENDFGREALDTLIAEMENHRSDLLVIMAGYPAEMEKLMEGNQGLASRMPYVIEFPNFNREELAVIFESMIKKPYQAGEGLKEKVKEYFNSLPDALLNSKQFSNARFVRNLFERTLAKSAIRLKKLDANEIIITKEDFELASSDKEFKSVEVKTRKIGFR